MSPLLLTKEKMVQQQPTAEIISDAILESGAPGCDSSVDAKLRWLRSQIIGGSAEIETPFGTRMLTYADHTASGRCLRYIEDYIIQTLLPFYGNTHTCDNYVGERTMKMFREATMYVKKCLGGTQDDALLFCGSGTTGAIKRLQEVLGIAIPSVLREKVLNSSCLRSAERWVVFVGPYEHHSNLLSWRQSLVEVIEIGLCKDGTIDMDDLQLRLEFYQGTGRPMLASFSACSNVTGIYSDTRSLARLLHKFGAFACFDFAARSGLVDGYDAITLSPHKFLGGPGSPGILLMSKTLYQLKHAPPSTCGGGTVNYVNCFNEQDTLYVNDIEEREDAGTPQIIQRVKAALAFQVKEYITCEVIKKKEQDYIRRALKRLARHSNILVLGNNTNVDRQAILSFLIYSTAADSTTKIRGRPLNGAFVAKLINDVFGIQARGGCSCAGPYGHLLLGIDEQHSLAIKHAVQMGYNGAKMGWTRVSFPYYMSNEEYEFIVAAIEFVASYGLRFLPLYHLNWNTGSWTFEPNTFKEIFAKEKDCKLCASFFSNTIQKPVNKLPNTRQKVGEYEIYLEVAKHIGNILPELSSQCTTLPTGLDPSHVFFQV